MLCTEGGRLLFAKNADQAVPMASITKVMTAVVALESSIELLSSTAVPEEAVGIEGSSVYLNAGDTVTVRDLLYAVMLSSANDASVALAISVSGNEEAFVRQMNQKAEELGMRSTSFRNPHGLSAEGHYTTARDYARPMAYALTIPEFREIIVTKRIRISVGDSFRSLSNHNRLLYSCDGMLGGKTGYTVASGRTLVTACERNGVTLICVTLRASDDWNDHRRLYDAGFDSVKGKRYSVAELTHRISTAGGSSSFVNAAPTVGFTVVIREGERVEARLLFPRFVYAPIKKGDRIGSVELYLDGRRLGEVPLIATEDNLQPPVTEKGFFARLIARFSG